MATQGGSGMWGGRPGCHSSSLNSAPPRLVVKFLPSPREPLFFSPSHSKFRILGMHFTPLTTICSVRRCPTILKPQSNYGIGFRLRTPAGPISRVCGGRMESFVQPVGRRRFG